MLKPIEEDTMFVPNYEDYDRTAINYGAAVYPQLWPAEMAGEGAIYDWHKSLAMQFHTMTASELVFYFKQLLTAEEKVAYQKMVVRTLAWLAERCGWKVKNDWAVEELEANPIFVTDKPIEDYKPPQPKDEGIKIDMQALESHMGDLMPPSYQLIQHKKKYKIPTNRKELQDWVCALLAKENGFKERGTLKTFYVI